MTLLPTKPHCSVVENRRLLVQSLAWLIFFPRINDVIETRFIPFSPLSIVLTMVMWESNGYVRKQPVALKEYCAEYWLKELQESMDRYTGCHDITEIPLKTVLNTTQSINYFYLGILQVNSTGGI